MFSAIALDQCYEQNSATAKGSGGAVGLTCNPGTLRRWMITGPEVARLILEFEKYQVCQEALKKITLDTMSSTQQ